MAPTTTLGSKADVPISPDTRRHPYATPASHNNSDRRRFPSNQLQGIEIPHNPLNSIPSPRTRRDSQLAKRLSPTLNWERNGN